MENKESVLITGCSTGIGRATALTLSKRGIQVFAGVRKTEDGEKLQAEKDGASITPLLLDVTKEEQLQSALQEVKKVTQGLDALINNAGIVVTAPLETIDMEQFHHQFEVNLFGLLRTTQVFLPLIRQRQGRILNISSISGKVASPFMGPYNASKFALEGLTDALRIELLPWKIPVISILPGPTETPIWSKNLDEGSALLEQLTPEHRNYYEKDLLQFEKTANFLKKISVPVTDVVDVIEKALEQKDPKPRYIVGLSQRLQTGFLQKLPDRWRDKIIRKQMRLTPTK